MLGLELSKKYLPCSVQVHLDSELVCKQMLGLYMVKDENLMKLFEVAKNLVEEFDKVDFKRIIN